MLKWIGLWAMTVDHVGAVWLGRSLELTTLIGRMAFPIFAFLVGINILRSRDPGRYIWFLLLAGVLSQPIVVHVLGRPGVFPLNIFFTLAAGALLSHLVFRARDPERSFLTACFVFGFVFVFGSIFEYGRLGVLLIFAVSSTAWMIRREFWAFSIPAGFVLCFAFLVNGPSLYYGLVAVATMTVCALLQLRGGRPVAPSGDRSFFYAYYPLHLLLIAPLMV